MVVSLLNTCGTSSLLNQPNLESTIHWRQSSQTTPAETEQQNCILNFNNRDQRPSSPVQNGEESSCFSSENGADNLSPRREPCRSPSSEDLGPNLFPITGCNMSTQCMDFSNSDNESSQASPSSFHDDDAAFRTSKSGNGSNGKPKVHKCRSCGFSSTNKNESWAHVATHMKPEKILRCPQCPFVTEYKHHLDFHLGNHKGIKPFKCDKCPYDCVNKSMLKSHMKSHSNVYQYSCSDCAYRTKYCHSLKIHLRKYRHQPGTVLDSDGNPNPNPVIDVYGNRRGPKQKPKKTDNGSLPMQPSVSPLNPFPNFSWANNVFFRDNSRISYPMLSNAIITPFTNEDTKPDIASQETDNLNNNVKIALNNNNNDLTNHEAIPNVAERVKMENDDDMDDKDIFQSDMCVDEKVPSPPQLPQAPQAPQLPQALQPNFLLPFERVPVVPVVPELPVPATTSVTLPLPLIKVEATVDDVPLNLSVSHSSSSSTETTTTPPVVKNRRKGVACKLKRTYPDDDQTAKSSTSAAAETGNGESTSSEPVPAPASACSPDTDNEILVKLKNGKKFLFCDYCEITFFNQIMFTMHMGYHGFADPFKCNRCGQKTENKIDFYNHMLSAAH